MKSILDTIKELSAQFEYSLYICSREETGGPIAQADIQTKDIRVISDLSIQHVRNCALAATMRYMLYDSNNPICPKGEEKEVLDFYDFADDEALVKHLYLHEVAHIELGLASVGGRRGDEVEHECDLWAARKLAEIVKKPIA